MVGPAAVTAGDGRERSRFPVVDPRVGVHTAAEQGVDTIVLEQAAKWGGTGTAAAINGVTVAGKTGTAENATGYDHSWFIGFAPAENPKVAVAVVIENANYGSATPIAGKVMQAALAELEK